MIGNDVVDLDLAKTESNWKRKGFLDKIFTKAEQQLILNDESPNILVWNFWSRKEAVYKIFNRETKIRVYNPIKFECSASDSDGNGTVYFKAVTYYTKTHLEHNCLKTIAVKNQSEFDKISILPNRKGIVKINGIPSIHHKPVSISNHGRFEEILVLNSES